LPHWQSPRTRPRLAFASRAKVDHAGKYDSLTDVQAGKMVPVRKVIDNDHLEPRSLNNRRREH